MNYKSILAIVLLHAVVSPTWAAKPDPRAQIASALAAKRKRIPWKMPDFSKTSLKTELSDPRNKGFVVVVKGVPSKAVQDELKSLLKFTNAAPFKAGEVIVVSRGSDPRQLSKENKLVVSNGEVRFRQIGRGLGVNSDLAAYGSIGAGPRGRSGITGSFFPEGDDSAFDVLGVDGCNSLNSGPMPEIGPSGQEYMDGAPDYANKRPIFSQSDEYGTTEVYETDSGAHYVVERDNNGNVVDVSSPEEPPQNQIDMPPGYVIGQKDNSGGGSTGGGSTGGGTQTDTKPAPAEPEPKPEDGDAPPPPKPDGDNMPNPDDVGGGGGSGVPGRHGPIGPGVASYTPDPDSGGGTGSGRGTGIGSVPGKGPGRGPIPGGPAVTPNPDSDGRTGNTSARPGRHWPGNGSWMPNPDDNGGGGPAALTADIFRFVPANGAKLAGNSRSGFFVGLNACGAKMEKNGARAVAGGFEKSLAKRSGPMAVQFTGLRLNDVQKAAH